MLVHAGDTIEPEDFKISKAIDDWVEPASNTATEGG